MKKGLTVDNIKDTTRKLRFCCDDAIKIYGNYEQHEFEKIFHEMVHVMIKPYKINYSLMYPNMFRLQVQKIQMLSGVISIEVT
jgi:hypothetical protein